MEADREKKVAEIKDKISKGNYRVDCKAVAEAIIKRLERGYVVPATANAESRTLVRSGR